MNLTLITITILTLPLLNSIYSGLFYKCYRETDVKKNIKTIMKKSIISNNYTHLSKKTDNITTYITTFFMAIVAFLCWKLFFIVNFQTKETFYLIFCPWIESGDLIIEWGFMFDSLTTTMLVVVTSISTLVHMYSHGYMSEDPHKPRFMAYLSFFTFFMILLVSAKNFVVLFLGWEGVGLCSYLLISFWYTRIQASKAAMKALIVNRIGDFGLSLGIFTIFKQFGSLDFTEVFPQIDTVLKLTPKTEFLLYNFETMNLICFLLFIGAIGKSAQVGLHTWLPDAMEGPTPVSALIHAATMVTAGVFLIIRCSPFFEQAPAVLSFMTFLGTFTCFFAATVGVFQNDLKKVIAYSTCSQLGYMVFACGLSNYQGSLYHLVNHAFFKALLFLGAGSVIHAMSDEQDMRKMGGLAKLLPYTYSTMTIGTLALTGFPFLAGFYSKDFILEVAFVHNSLDGLFAFWFGSIAAFLTSFYSFRLVYLTFLTKTNAYKAVIKKVHECPTSMGIPLFILTIGSIFIGYLGQDYFIFNSSEFFKNSIISLDINTIQRAEDLPFYIKLIPTVFSLLGSFLAIYVYHNLMDVLIQKHLSKSGLSIYNFFNKKWYFDKVYNLFINKTILHKSYSIFYITIDKGLIEILGPQGLTTIFYKLSKKLNKLHSGLIYNYISLLIVINLVIYFNLKIINVIFFI